MAYGSGKPSWSRGGDIEDGNSGLNRRNNVSGNGGGGSYQRGEGAGSNYQPPQVKGTYAEQQTHVVEDTLRTHVQVSIAFFFTLAIFRNIFFSFVVYFPISLCPITNLSNIQIIRNS